MSVTKNMGLVKSVSSRSTASLTRVSFSSVSGLEASKKLLFGDTRRLYRRLSALGMKKGMVSTTINSYIREGQTPTKLELESCVKELRNYGKPHLALEIMDWMETRGIRKSLRHFPVYLDLVAKVKGIEEAEVYFNGLSDMGKSQWTYGALLNCYCTQLMEDKALALFKEMEKKNLAFTSVAFGNVMSLYMKLGKPEKVAPLVEGMKRRNMELSTFIYCLWMSSCSRLRDVEGAERAFAEAEKASWGKCDWTIYSNLAATYVKAGNKEKAEVALKKVEEAMGPQDQKAYQLLISLYARVSNLSEIHRLWKSLTRKFEVATNMSYLVILQALGKLDRAGLKDCYEEWESRCHSYDWRLAHEVVRIYLRNHMVEEAQAVFHHAKKRSYEYPFMIEQTFMIYYLRNNEGQQALDCMKAAVSQVKNNEWHLQHGIIKEFLRYFEKIGDVDFGEEFCRLLKKVNSLNYAAYKSLLGTYVVAGKTAPNMAERIKEDGIAVDTNLTHLLQKVCPESEQS